MENFFQLKILNEGTEQDGLMDVEECEYKGICVTNCIWALGK